MSNDLVIHSPLVSPPPSFLVADVVGKIGGAAGNRIFGKAAPTDGAFEDKCESAGGISLQSSLASVQSVRQALPFVFSHSHESLTQQRRNATSLPGVLWESF